MEARAGIVEIVEARMTSETKSVTERFGFFLALALPFVACALQWLLWPFIRPFVWFLFFPAVFFSARIGSIFAGIAASFLSSLLVWYFFIPPQFSFRMENPNNFFSIGLFMVMGVLFSLTHDRLRKANRQAVEALDVARAANEELQDANRQINDLYQKTLELDKLKTQFFSNVSHELRTPLTLILAPLHKSLAHPGLSETLRANLELMQRNAQLLYQHVSDLLDISKIEAGRMDVRYGNVDLAHLLRVIASHFENMAADRGIRYAVSTPEALSAQIDGEKIRRILLNLLSNAFKFVPDGGSISLTLAAENNQAVIGVRDNGPGVPAAMRTTIFERFSQVEGHAGRTHGGTGLGLSIVKEFSGLLGGDIVCNDAPDGGAHFTLTLPLMAPPGVTVEEERRSWDAAPAPFEAIPRRTASPAPQTETSGLADPPLILVVEDNLDMNAYVAEVLRPHYRVVSAFNGEEGLERAIKTQPDLIVTDVMMPKMSGDLMVEAMHRRAELAEVPIVMLSAKADDELRLKLLQQGVQEYLNKPFSDEELLARVKRLLAERRRSMDQLRASEAKFRYLFENMLNSVVHARMIFQGETPVDLEYLETNPAFAAVTGITESVRGRRISEVIPGYCENNPESLSTFGQVALTGVPRRWEHYLRELDRWFSFMIYSPVRGEVVIVTENITERKRAEEQILLLNTDLEQRVEQRTAELLAANQELDSFAYAVSHDLRAPLRAMSGFSQALIEDYGDSLQGEAGIYLEQIIVGSRKMGELIDGLLTLSRSTRGQLQRARVDLSAMAEQLLRELSAAEPERRVHQEVEPGFVVQGDGVMLEVVLRNLLANAWKYTSGREEATIRFFSRHQGAQRFFCVADNGAGFDAAHAAKLFQPFQRLHRQEEFPGIGIGLATAQRIIHRHGGAMLAEGRRDQGATFCFSLPDHDKKRRSDHEQ